MSRHNLYADSLRDKTCVEDWECDGRHLSCDGVKSASERKKCESDLLAQQGSTCDPAARRCTVPLSMRPLRPIAYRLSKHFPPYLAREAFASMAQWNEALMRGERAATGLLPIDQVECSDAQEQADEAPDQKKGDGVCTVNLSRSAEVTCQTENPAAFCYCGSPEEQKGACHRAYDPFESPAAARKRGVPNPYDCYVKGPADVKQPKDYADYAPAKFYGYQFVGKECILTLQANSCDLDPSQPCEELGDLRYQFVTHLQHGSVGFGGITQPLSDPTTGELIVSNTTAAAESIESIATTASQFFPVLRGETPEDQYFSGETLRGYFARLGRDEHPVSIAPSGTEGFRAGDASRPTSTTDGLQNLQSRMQEADQRVKQLAGQEGRAAILSDRQQLLHGSELAARIDAAVNSEAASETDSGGTTQLTSIVDNSPLDDALRERQRRQVMASRNMDSFEDKLYNSQYWQYWATSFKGRSPAEASLRMQQKYFGAVMTHELGHSLGLRHNFAASLDRNNYHDPYFAIARANPLPAFAK